MKKLVLSFLLFCQLQATAQLNIVNGGSTPSGSGWSITGNTLTVTGNVSIDADIITQHLLNTGDLEVNVTSPAAGGVQVYPLPVTTGSVSVKLPSDMPLKLFNTSGMIVREVNGRAGIQQVNVEFLPKGIYYLKAGTETIRVLVQ